MALRLVVAALALLILPLGIVTLFLPIRPATPLAITAYILSGCAGTALGVWWLRLRRPSWGDALTFVVCADAVLVVGSLTQSGWGRIGATMFFGMVAMLIAFLLGWRILLVHCLFSLAVIAAATAMTMRVDDVGFGELYPIVAPAATIAFALPVVVQFAVEAGRRGLGKVTEERDRDTLTGLYGRRGADLALRRRLRDRSGHVAVVAVLDLDGFKEFNDAHGHLAGDEKLIETAHLLRSGVRGRPLLARMGGDEFLVVGTGEADAAAVLVDDLHALVVSAAGPPRIAGSIGVTVTHGLDPALLSQAIAVADAALYEAKADRTRRIVVHDRRGAAR
ncbi:putative diguanylate cyclase AdrA [Tsukamurella hominis]